MTPEASRVYLNCNTILYPGATFVNVVSNPGPVDYTVGDKLRIDLVDPILCPSDDFEECVDDNRPVDIPTFSFEYVIVPDDFDCD